MLESPILPGPQGESAAHGPLRPLQWCDLMARFAAQRDLRLLLSLERAGLAGSFGSLAHPLAVREGARGGGGKRGVNPEALAAGKCRRSIPAKAVMTKGERESK